MHPTNTPFGFAPYRLSGTVYGVLLNHAPALAALGDAVNAPPYKAPPKAPVLYLKPRNTLSAPGQAIHLPVDVPALQIGANLGAVIGRTACCVSAAQALDFIAGYAIVNDLSVPHEAFFRPSVRFKALDGSCAIGPVHPRSRITHPDRLPVRVFVDGQLAQSTDTGNRQRPLAKLLADITDFMTLAPGDIVLLGTSHGAPVARAGQRISVDIEGLGRLDNTLAAATGAAHDHPLEPHA
jgi:5-oxopent-3-ene-1,2,5-tricarboxylate decarboxylase / 2-hydroxyhepta-2,4-diene-1,7-dioate isomerase